MKTLTETFHIMIPDGPMKMTIHPRAHQVQVAVLHQQTTRRIPAQNLSRKVRTARHLEVNPREVQLPKVKTPHNT